MKITVTRADEARRVSEVVEAHSTFDALLSYLQRPAVREVLAPKRWASLTLMAAPTESIKETPKGGNTEA